MATVEGMPMPQEDVSNPPLQHGLVNLDQHPAHRTAAVVLCLFYAILLALVQGYRAGRTAGCKTRTRFMEFLVYAQGIICTACLFVVGIIVTGLGLQTDAQCYIATRLCILMYGSDKIALTLLLLERVHIVRAPFVKRTRDPIWIIGGILTVSGWVGMMSGEFIDPTANLSRVDGVCRIGVQPGAAIAMTVFDTVLNATFTAIFIFQLRPAFSLMARRLPVLHNNTEEQRTWWSRQSSHSEYTTARTSGGVTAHNNLRRMLIRNVVGSIMLLVNVIVNNVIYIQYHFAKMAHACLLMCLTDIVLGMLITHWLTMRSAEDTAQRNTTTHSTSDSNVTTVRSRRATMDYSTLRTEAFSQFGEKPAPVVFQGDKDTIDFNPH